MVSQGFIAIVMAAGKGTRMRSPLPKVLHKVLGKTMLFYVLRALKEAGCQRVVAVVGYGREQVEAELAVLSGELGLAVDSVEQVEQLGTGHAVQMALPKLALLGASDEVLIVNGDALLLHGAGVQEFLSEHKKKKAALSLACLELANPQGYGRVVVSSGTVKKVVEEKDASPKEKKVRLVNGGLYCLQAGLLKRILPKLKPSPVTKEFYLTEIVSLAAKEKKRVSAVCLEASLMQGANDLLELSQAEAIARQRIVAGWMKAGVKIFDPDRTWIENDVELAPGAVLEPDVMLLGRTRIEEGAVIETGARIESSSIARGARIKAHSYLTEAQVGERAQVGPFAHLRPGTVLGAETKVGNFVEIKKSVVGSGSKLSHLSYLGDAKVGADVNIGCGFITCNYDGFQKQETVIEDGAFIGSDVQTVAPLRVGKGAYVGSGTTLTRSVPEGALAIARAKQENKEGYADRLKERFRRAAVGKKEDK